MTDEELPEDENTPEGDENPDLPPPSTFAGKARQGKEEPSAEVSEGEETVEAEAYIEGEEQAEADPADEQEEPPDEFAFEEEDENGQEAEPEAPEAESDPCSRG